MKAESNGRDAFDAIYEENAEIVYQTAKRYVGNHHAAEEIMQETFLKLFQVMENTNIRAAKPWLILTAKYAAMNYKRDGSREYPVAEFTEEEEERLSRFFEDPQECFAGKQMEKEYIELADEIFAAIYKKNKRWYDALTITYVLEKPQKQVAEQMGMDLESFHSMLYRARKWVRDHYEYRLDRIREF
ncbi:sigma-70 family RNA polymerase sigma factor [uncultured Merdimonas sp.]|uniref:RNA polymerase sigma factor n=1 Tax=uncultured Merdimonas sp. TaxID=2023269 RepID=UPI00320AC682